MALSPPSSSPPLDVTGPLHSLKRAKCEPQTEPTQSPIQPNLLSQVDGVTPQHAGHAEHVHKSTLDEGAIQFTQADRDNLTELKAYLDRTNAKMDNLPRRLANSHASCPLHTLVRLGVEEPTSPQPLGTLPHFKQQAGGDNPPPDNDDLLSIFPATRGDLADLGMSDLDKLEAFYFYGVRFAGACRVARMSSFMFYIGT